MVFVSIDQNGYIALFWGVGKYCRVERKNLVSEASHQLAIYNFIEHSLFSVIYFNVCALGKFATDLCFGYAIHIFFMSDYIVSFSVVPLLIAVFWGVGETSVLCIVERMELSEASYLLPKKRIVQNHASHIRAF